MLDTLRTELRGLRPRRSREGLSRTIAFGDAVVAIAITLIVLPLIDVGSRWTFPLSVWVNDHRLALLAAAISFGSIGGFWRDHRQLYERATGYTWLVTRLNLAWLASIAFLPVATVVLVHGPGDKRPEIALYFTVLCITISLLNLQELELLRAGLTNDDPRPGAIELAGRWIPVALRLVALLIAVSAPGIGLWAIAIVLLGTPLEAATTILGRRRAARRRLRAG